jgi:hypothetical protein
MLFYPGLASQMNVRSVASRLVALTVVFQGLQLPQQGRYRRPIQRNVCHAFASFFLTVRSGKHHPSIMALQRKEEEGDESFNSCDKNIPQLPALGAGSGCFSSTQIHQHQQEVSADYSESLASTTSISGRTNTTASTAFVSPKFELQYTCNVCDTRNRVIIKRMAYRQGMVIAICKGCDSKHWIADNLDPTLTVNNIEELFACRNESQPQQQQEHVSRVTQEVYDIERVWGFKPGEMTDSQGNPVLQ